MTGSFASAEARFLLFSAILLGLGGARANAQSFQVRNYGEGDGLPSNTVYAICQDLRGRMWFATRSGIASYDGKNWVTYNSETGLPTLNYQKLVIDAQGTVWAATNFDHRMVASFREGQWQIVEGPEPIPSEDSFFFEVTIRDELPLLAIGHATLGLFIREGNEWQHFGEAAGLTGRLRGLTSRSGKFYAVTDRGLTVFDGQGADRELDRVLVEPYRNLVGIAFEEEPAPVSADNPATLWLLGDRWLGTLSGDRFEVRAELPFLSPLKGPHMLLPDLTGGLFFGQPNQIHHFRAPYGKVFDFGKDNQIFGATDLYLDREKNLWISGLRGVHKIVNLRFANYRQVHGLLEDEVTAVLEWQPGRWLLGHNSGFSYFDGSEWHPLPLQNSTGEKRYVSRVMDLRKGFEGEAWAALSEMGIARIGEDLDIRIYETERDRQIYTLLPDPGTGRVWLGGLGGISYFERDRIAAVDEPGAPTSDVRRLILGSGDRIYAATSGQGLMIKSDAWRAYTSQNPQANEVYTVFEDSRGLVWAGTLAGLYRPAQDMLKPFDHGGFELKRPTFLIVEDHKHRLWFGTDHGVFRFDGHTAQHFTMDQGLAGKETNRAAGMTDHLGRVWIGTDGGVSLYQERLDHQDLPPPLLELEKIEVSGKSHAPDETLTLAHDDNDLVFHFRALSFIDEGRLGYQCRLAGYDAEWLPVSGAEYRQMRYTNLSPGRYRFQVKARNARGTWTEPVSSQTIVIRKPFWGSLWFIGLMILAVLGISYSGFDYVSSKRNSRFLEAQVARRTRELERKIVQHQQAEAQIQKLNQDLEARIRIRTAELEAAHKDLVESAHYAGMAEIATSMLHNVGNILNSIGTSGFLIRSSVNSSKVASLTRANHLLEKHLPDIETFIRRDPKGKRLLRLYLDLGKILQKENEEIAEHVDTLLEKINVIRDVVIAQNNYATGVFQYEVMPLQDLVEASLNIMATSLSTKGIHIEKHYAPVAKVTIQKTKVIHTLVNILKNAKDALVQDGSPTKKITISITEREGRVFLKIVDTGSGIAKSHLKKIFNHGFTTKPDGHGFGLHSCANAMQEMGGAIWAESEGLGKGASFILQFPAPQKVPAA